MFKQHVRANFLETTKVFGLLRKKKRIYPFYTCYTRDLGASWSAIVHKSLCVSLCIACFSFGPIHIQYSTLKKKFSWPQVFVVQKLFKFPGRGGAPALLWWQLQQNPEHFRGNNPHQVMLSPARSGGNSNNMMELSWHFCWQGPSAHPSGSTLLNSQTRGFDPIYPQISIP